MKKSIKLLIATFFLFFLPIFAIAQVTITNPIEYESLTELLDGIINFLLAIAAPIITIMVLYSAFLFMTSGGEKDKITKAKSTLTYVVIGVVVLLLSKAMVSLINSFLS